jgi:hypothetical protein
MLAQESQETELVHGLTVGSKELGPALVPLLPMVATESDLGTAMGSQARLVDRNIDYGEDE